MGERYRYFPLFYDLRGKQILFVGGGRVAARRIRVLLHFEGSITIITPQLSRELSQLLNENEDDAEAGVRLQQRQFMPKDLDGADLVFICTSDKKLNRDIFTLCAEKGIPANDCSSRERCDFFFPSVAAGGSFLAGIISGGSDHKAMPHIRQRVSEILQEEAASTAKSHDPFYL